MSEQRHLIREGTKITVCGLYVTAHISTVTLAMKTTCMRCRRARYWHSMALRPIEIEETEHGALRLLDPAATDSPDEPGEYDGPEMEATTNFEETQTV